MLYGELGKRTHFPSSALCPVIAVYLSLTIAEARTSLPSGKFVRSLGSSRRVSGRIRNVRCSPAVKKQTLGPLPWSLFDDLSEAGKADHLRMYRTSDLRLLTHMHPATGLLSGDRLIAHCQGPFTQRTMLRGHALDIQTHCSPLHTPREWAISSIPADQPRFASPLLGQAYVGLPRTMWADQVLTQSASSIDVTFLPPFFPGVN